MASKRPRGTPSNNREALLGVRGEGREGGKHPSRGEGLVIMASKRLVTQRVGGLLYYYITILLDYYISRLVD